MDLLLRAKLFLHQIDMLKYPHIDRTDLPGLVATEEIIDIIECPKIIGAGFVSIGHIQPLIRPNVDQCQSTFGKLASLNGLRTNQPPTQQESPDQRNLKKCSTGPDPCRLIGSIHDRTFLPRRPKVEQLRI